eukprot:667255-Prorocentrum_minimum.AAC.1
MRRACPPRRQNRVRHGERVASTRRAARVRAPLALQRGALPKEAARSERLYGTGPVVRFTEWGVLGL